MMQGRYDDIRRCCGCDHCVGDGFSGRMTECAINASFQREATYRIDPAPVRKRIVIAGAGVGGLEAARVCATRGHEVLLFEKEPNVGGMIRDVSKMPHLYMRELNYSVDWLSSQAKKLGVQLTTGQEVTTALIENLQPDVVVVATGSRPVVPTQIPGINLPHVMTQEHYLKKSGKVEVGKNVVVIGGQFGAELCLSLAREGRNVTLIEEGSGNVASAPYLVKTVTRYIYCSVHLNKDQVNVRTGMKVKEIKAGSIICTDIDGDQEEFAADTVFLCLPRAAENRLSAALKEQFSASDAYHAGAAYNSTKLELGGKICDLYELGDCVEPRTMKEAIHQASLFSLDI
jgi:pyruvate/2-oxoglutarate dehydrogenase complex dihydrolipoamide dehydrogenase (E3) component